MKKIYIGFFLLFSSLLTQAQNNDRTPKEERPIQRLDLSVNRIPFVQTKYPQLNGQGFVVSLKEFRFDREDIDLLGKDIPNSSSTPFTSIHATNMATIIGGLGNSAYTGLGIAPEVFLSSTNFFHLAPESIDYYRSNDISVQNHSYGIGIENFYGSEARAYDSLVYALPYLVHVFSAGNIGDSTSVEGPYAGIAGFANLTGTFKQAKNVLTIGAVDPEVQVETRSSRGPAYDGRIKPELVAFGEDGSSGAAAITSGLAVLLQQAFAEKHQGQLPPAALIRGTLINTADDLLQPGPDFISGFGNLNARRALQQIQSGQYLIDTLAAGTHRTLPISLPQYSHQLNATLAWTDPEAEILVETALVNDLDLWIEDSLGNIYSPWVLNQQPQLDSLQLPAYPGLDTINTQEKVSINQPGPGKYTLHILNRGQAQPFALTYYFQASEEFFFVSPTTMEPLSLDSIQTIRWDWTGEGKIGQLAYRYIDTQTWEAISNIISLSKHQYTWKTPDRPGSIQLRMSSGDSVYYSDTLTISPDIPLRILSDCGDQVILNWSPFDGIEEYTVYQLIDGRMRPVATVQDSFYLAEQGIEPAVFAVAPVLPSGKSGRRSLALITDLQQSSCYVENFTARLQDQQGRIDLNLSTNFNIAGLQLQKWDGEQFITIQEWPGTNLDYTYTDTDIQLGNNYYRVQIELIKGQVLFTNTRNIFFVPEDGILLYPNPVSAGQELQLSIPTFQGRSIDVYDARGRLILREDIFSPLYRLETQNWAAGLYFFSIVSTDGKQQHQGKIIVK